MLILLFQRLRRIRAKFFIGNLNTFVICYLFLKLEMEMGIEKGLKKEIIKGSKVHDTDTGSPVVQIALLTERSKEKGRENGYSRNSFICKDQMESLHGIPF